MPPIEQTVVITGAAGRIGRAIVPLLRRPGRTLRLVDTSPVELEGDDVSWHEVSIEDGDGMERMLEGTSGVVHLAGLSSERPWADLLRVNIDGTHTVLEAARRTGVERVLLASSIHAVGFAPIDAAAATEPLLPRPDTYYGVSKAAMEALGSLYADRFGMSVVSARICMFLEQPTGRLAIAEWLSPGDMVRLVEASLALDDGMHHIVWGVSANAPGWFSLDAGFAIGYRPQDDARAVSLERDGVEPAEPDRAAPLGGAFTDEEHPVGGSW
jgi:uronate dehydrogenase